MRITKETAFLIFTVLFISSCLVYFCIKFANFAPAKANFQRGGWDGNAETIKLEILPTTCLCPEGNCACYCYCLYEGCNRICNCTMIEPEKTESNQPTDEGVGLQSGQLIRFN